MYGQWHTQYLKIELKVTQGKDHYEYDRVRKLPESAVSHNSAQWDEKLKRRGRKIISLVPTHILAHFFHQTLQPCD